MHSGSGAYKGEEIWDKGSPGTLRTTISRTFDLYNRLNVTYHANENADFDYSPDGTLDKEMDGKGATTEYDYDDLKRLVTTIQDFNGTDPNTANIQTDYQYDSQDNLTRVTDPLENDTLYEYDDLGNLLSIDSPDTGLTVFTYDEAGNTKTKKDAKNQLTTYSYDALNRITFVDAESDATNLIDDITYQYDSCVYGIGRLCNVIRALGTTELVVVSYSYNALGDITSHQGVDYTYDASGRVKSVTYPSGAVVTYHYDLAGQINQVSLVKQPGEPSVILADNINYHPFGPVASLDYGNGITLTQTLDDGYRLKDILVPGVINISNMLYDANGNFSERTHDTASELFSYDAINRLDGSDGALGVRVFSYDSNGNRIQLTEDGSTTSYGYDAGNNRLSSIGANNVQTDDNGNTIIKGNWTFSYTSDNRLENVHNGSTLVASYFYNGLGQRSSKAIMADQSRVHYGYGRDGSLLVEQDDQGNVNKEYVYLDSSLIAVLESSISTSSQLSFSDGSNLMLVDENARQVQLIPGGEDPTTVLIPENDWIVHDLGSIRIVQFQGTDAQNIQLYGSLYFFIGASGSSDYSVINRLQTPEKSVDYYFSSTPGSNVYTGYDPFTGNTATLTVEASTRSITIEEQGLPAEAYTIDESDWVVETIGGYEYTTFTYADGDLSVSGQISQNGVTNNAGLHIQIGSYQSNSYFLYLQESSEIEVNYVHSDHLGTPKAVTDESGTVVWRANHDPFGAATVAAGSIEFNLRFPGQYYDQETGLHYNYFRTYDFSTGRYLESDPIGLRGGLNTYAYVGGNPILFIDPLGLAGCYVGYPGYPITIPNTDIQVPITHAGVVSYDAKGNTRYYEYGRYDSDFGNVRRRAIPDVEIGPDGQPTPQSWAEMVDAINRFGNGVEAELDCDTEADADDINEFAENRMNDRNRAPYSWKPWSYNTCTTFANDAMAAGAR